MAFLFGAGMRLRFGLTRLYLMTQTSQTCVPTNCYSAFVFNLARIMIHANVTNPKLNVYWEKTKEEELMALTKTNMVNLSAIKWR